MLSKVKTIWTSLNREIVVNQRELVLGIAACTLSGVLMGVFLTPKKTTTIGSYNGSNNSGNEASLATEAEAPCEKEA